MVEFSRYYIEFVIQFFKNLWSFVITILSAIKTWLFDDLVAYFRTLVASSNDFTVLDWIVWLLVFAINAALVVFIVLRLVQIIRRKIRMKKNEVEKDDLLDEIASLNNKVVELVDEKNKLFALKVSQLGLSPYAEEDKDYFGKGDKKKEEKAPANERFPRLAEIDERYGNEELPVTMLPDDMLSLEGLVARFVNYAASRLHLYYTTDTIARYFAGLGTSKILILEGISGTGKTSLPYAMGKFFGNDSEIVSVQPSYRDRGDLMGYLNEFTKKFNETDFLADLYETIYRQDLNFIILDEMNLARIEYYFAEFLSIMEMPNPSEWKIDIVSEPLPGDPHNLHEGKLTVPQNVWFVGTANKDDSTFTITDKVYDRAISLIMNTRANYIDAPFTKGVTMSYEYLNNLFNEALKSHPLSAKAMDNIAKIDVFISDHFKLTFGNRITRQFRTFVPIYCACGEKEEAGLDYMLRTKVLRKFEALNLSFLHDDLEALIVFLDKLYGKGVFKESIEYIKELEKNS